jgi:hypothetical protein
MKRCPQCEFIYEDDQSLCDMDGIRLVLDSRSFPKSDSGKKSQWRSRMVTALATLVLSTVLYLVCYVSIHHEPPRSSYSPAAVPAAEVKATDKKPADKKLSPPSPELKSSKEEKPKPNAKAVKTSEEKAKVKSTQKPQSPVQRINRRLRR